MSTQTLSQPFSRILVALDGSSYAALAVPYASRLAMPGSTITLLRVLRHAAPLAAALKHDRSSTGGSAEQHIDLALEELERDAGPLRREDLVIQPIVTIGDPASEILQVAQIEKVNLIVLATHGRGTIGRLAYGSVADRIVRHSLVPVLVVRREEESAGPADQVLSEPVLRRLVIPLDGSDLSRRALPVAEDVASRLGLAVHLVTVLDPTAMAEPAVALGAAFSTELYEEMNAEMRSSAEEELTDAATRITKRGIIADWAIREGPVADTLTAELLPGDLMILSSHGRGGVSRWLLGSVAERLVRQASVPVLLLPVPGRAQLHHDSPDAEQPVDITNLLHRDAYRPEDLASLLEMDVNQIRSEVFAGNLPARLLNHHIIEIRREDALRWLRDRE